MELRQLRYFVKVCELRSMGRAAVELGVVTSALSQQISRLEGELSTRLLKRSASGVVPTDAGVASCTKPNSCCAMPTTRCSRRSRRGSRAT